jgi:hypothetical protein
MQQRRHFLLGEIVYRDCCAWIDLCLGNKNLASSYSYIPGCITIVQSWQLTYPGPDFAYTIVRP